MTTKYFSPIRLLLVAVFCGLFLMAGCADEDETGTGGDGNGNGTNYNDPPDINYTKGVQVTLDSIDGLYDDTSIVTGETIKFHIRLNNNTGSAITGLTHGFVVYSYENAATWSSTEGAFDSSVEEDMFDGGSFVIGHFNRDGMNVDTIGFGGYKIQGTGIPAGFNDIAFTIRIGPIAASHHGRWICLDSSFYPPGGGWLWPTTGGTVIPDWDGARWFRIVDTSR